MASQRPTRRLGSKTLSQALENFIVPVVAKAYSVISVRALWNAKKNDEELAKCHLAAKRRQLEIVLRSLRNILLVWTCITGIEVKPFKANKNVDKNTRPENEDGQERNENNSDDTDEDEFSIKPGISFWIVVDLPQHSLKDTERKITQVILTSGLEVENCRPIQARKKDSLTEYYSATLCQALKDHNSYYAEHLAKDGAQHYASSAIRASTGTPVRNYEVRLTVIC